MAPQADSFTVWIMVENDMDENDPPTYWSVEHHETKEEAIAHAQDIANAEYARSGVEPVRLDE